MSAPEPAKHDVNAWPGDHLSANGASPRAAAGGSHRVVVLGYITAVAMPPVGFIIGLVLAVRVRAPASRRGLWIITLSVVAAIGWVLAVATGLLSPNTTTST